MSSPFGEEIDLNDKANILDAIFNTPPKKINNINIGVMYSDKELNHLRKVYDGEIDDVTHVLIKNNFDSNTLSSLDIGTLEYMKQYFQSNFLNDVFLSVDKSPLIDLLRPISENIYHSSCDEMKVNISLKSDKIIGLIDVEIKNQENKEVERRRAEEEQRRIQAEVEIKRIQLENARNEELMREKLRIEKENQEKLNLKFAEIEEKQKRREENWLVLNKSNDQKDIIDLLKKRVESLENRSQQTQKFHLGQTNPQDWQTFSDGITVKIDISKFKLKNTPLIFTSLVGNNFHWSVTGATSIYYPSPTEFNIYMRIATKEVAVSSRWAINYILVSDE